MQDIADRAGIAVGGVYIYFKSKRQLLVVLMNDLLQQLQALQLEPPVARNMKAELRRFLASALETDRENYGVIRAWQEAMANDPELAAMNRGIEKWTRERIRRTFEAIRSHEAARKRVDVDVFARVMDRHLWGLLGRAATMSKRAFDEEVEVTSDIIYHYLVSDATE
jgi:AcrR family transcriptional regulator